MAYSGKPMMWVAVASVGGGLASGVGLGGGVVFNPVLIGLGYDPQVTASTGMYMIMFSAFLNSVTFYLFDNLNLVYAYWIGFWSSIAIAIFLTVVGAIIKKYKRPSVVVFILGSVIALSAVVIPTLNIQHLMYEASQGKDVWAFGSLC